MATILGCSPGTQAFGIAIVRNEVLVEWEVLTFRGKWSREKLDAILEKIETLILVHEIENIAVKIPDVFPTSMGYNQLIGSLNVLFEREGMRTHYFTLSELKQHCALDKDTRKESLADYIVGKHAELRSRYTPEAGTTTDHHLRVFEAVCAARLKLEDKYEE